MIPHNILVVYTKQQTNEKWSLQQRRYTQFVYIDKYPTTSNT